MAEMNLKERFSEAYNNIKNPVMDSTNPFFNNAEYASLDSVLKVIREVGRQYKVNYRQKLWPERDEHGLLTGNHTYKSFVWWEDEQLEISEIEVFPATTPQQFGGNCTYAKRQQAMSDWNIAGEKDLDGTEVEVSSGKVVGWDEQEVIDVKPEDEVTPEMVRLKYLWDEISELREEAIKKGVRANGISEYAEATFKDSTGKSKILGYLPSQPKERTLTVPEAEQFKKYLKDMVSSVEETKNERSSN